jgi:hypothetical protein
MWDKWDPVINATRDRENAPYLWRGFEYLYNELKRIGSEKGYPDFQYTKPPE